MRARLLTPLIININAPLGSNSGSGCNFWILPIEEEIEEKSDVCVNDIIDYLVHVFRGIFLRQLPISCTQFLL